MALSFSGAAYWYTQENPSALNVTAYTAMCWARPGRLSGFQACFSRQVGTGSGESIWLGYDGTSVNTFISMTTSSFAVNGAGGVVGAWQHLAVTFNQSLSPMARIYLNGTQLNSGSGVGTLQSTTRGLMVGGNNNTAGIAVSDAFLGLLDDVRIYNRVMTEAEIGTIATGRGKDGIVSGLLCRYGLNELGPGLVGTIIPNLANDPQLSLITQGGSPSYIEGVTVSRSRRVGSEGRRGG